VAVTGGGRDSLGEGRRSYAVAVDGCNVAVAVAGVWGRATADCVGEAASGVPAGSRLNSWYSFTSLDNSLLHSDWAGNTMQLVIQT
jgi:hypothetical protein